MATIDLGKVAFTHKGTYSSGTTYEEKDVVQYTDGDITSTFVYINSTSASGQTPSTGGTVNTTYWSLMAKGQPQSFNKNDLTNAISTLAIRQATQENKSAYNTNSMYVDVFQDSTGITGLTNCLRSGNEYMAAGLAATGGVIAETKFLVDGKDSTNPFRDRINNVDPSLNDQSGTGGTPVRDASAYKFSGHTGVVDLNMGTINYGTLANVDFSKAFTIEFWAQNVNNPTDRDRYWSIGTRGTSSSAPEMSYGFDYSSSGGSNFNNYADTDNQTTAMGVDYPVTSRTWHHHLWQKHTDGSDGDYSFYLDGTRRINGTHTPVGSILNEPFGMGGRPGTTGEYIDILITDFMIHQKRLHTGSSFTLQTAKSEPAVEGGSATGSFTSNNITAPSSITKMGAIVSYEDNSGTNALNTDIVLQLSADGGSNYATATLTALPNYSSTIKMAKVNDVTVTAGTNLKYKLNFANQSAGSKIARIRGVSLMY